MNVVRLPARLAGGGGRWEPAAFVGLAVATGLVLVALPLLPVAMLVGVTAVLLVTLIQPLFGLGLALLLGPLGALEGQLLGSSGLDSGQLLLLLTLAAWTAGGLLRRRIHLPYTFLNGPFFLFILAALLTLPGAPSIDYGLRELLKWVEMALIMLLVVDVAGRMHGMSTSRHSRLLPVLVGMLLLAGVTQALVGIWQFGLRGDGPEHFLVLGRFYRAYGTFEQPNPFGGYLNLSALLAMGVMVGLLAYGWQVWRGRGANGLSARFWLALLLTSSGLVLTTLGVAASWSRGAWLGFAAGTAVLLLFLPRRPSLGLLFVVVALLAFGLAFALGLVPTAVTARIAGFAQDLTFGDVRGVDINDANYAVLERLAHWQAAFDMARDHLWTGVGFGNYEPAYADYALINWPAALGHAHNYYINLLAEVGVLGLVTYLVLWTAVFWQTLRTVRGQTWPARGVALGLLAAWTALSVHHFVDKLYVNNIYIHLGVMFGVLQLLDRPKSKVADAPVAAVGR